MNSSQPNLVSLVTRPPSTQLWSFSLKRT